MRWRLRAVVLVAALCALISTWRHLNATIVSPVVVSTPQQSQVARVAQPIRQKPPPPPSPSVAAPKLTPQANHYNKERAAAAARSMDRDAAKASDPRKVKWGGDAKLHGRPPAIDGGGTHAQMSFHGSAKTWMIFACMEVTHFHDFHTLAL